MDLNEIFAHSYDLEQLNATWVWSLCMYTVDACINTNGEKS